MIDIGSHPWLIQYGETTPRKIEFLPDKTFRIEDDYGVWAQSDRTLTLSGEFLSEAVVFEETDEGLFVSHGKLTISIYPGVNRTDLLKTLRAAGIHSFELSEVEEMDGQDWELSIVNLLRKALMYIGFYHQGNYFQSTQESLLLLTGRTAQIPSLEFSKIFPITWMDASNKPQQFSNPEEWFNLYEDMQKHIQACHANSTAIKLAIMDGQGYDLALNWPKTRFPIDLLIRYFF